MKHAKTLLLAACLLVSASCLAQTPRPDTYKNLEIGQPLPAFTIKDAEGNTWTNADIAGRPTAINLWYTGCRPCRAEMPELSTWKEEMPDVHFFSITFQTPEDAMPVLEAQGFNWTPVFEDTQFQHLLDHEPYPMTILVGKDGRVAMVENGGSPRQREALKAKLQSLR